MGKRVGARKNKGSIVNKSLINSGIGKRLTVSILQKTCGIINKTELND